MFGIALLRAGMYGILLINHAVHLVPSNQVMTYKYIIMYDALLQVHDVY